MGRLYEIPGGASLELEHLILDVNGTLTNRGELIDGVPARLRELGADLRIELLSSDTRGTLDQVGRELGTGMTRISRGTEKRSLIEGLGSERCAAIGNGVNDAPMLECAALGVAVVGPEGVAGASLRSADVVCVSIVDALDLLLEPKTMASTMRP